MATTALLAGVLGVLGSLVAGRATLPGNGFTRANGYEPLSLADGPTLRAAVGTVLYLALVALLSLGVATAVRGTAGAITGVLTLLYAFPIVAQLVSDPRWQQRLERYGPMEAGLSVQHTMRLDELPIGPWPGLGVLATYAGVALLSGMTLFQLRDRVSAGRAERQGSLHHPTHDRRRCETGQGSIRVDWLMSVDPASHCRYAVWCRTLCDGWLCAHTPQARSLSRASRWSSCFMV